MHSTNRCIWKVIAALHYKNSDGVNHVHALYACVSYKVGDSQPFYDLVPLGHPVLSTRTTSSRTTNLIES